MTKSMKLSILDLCSILPGEHPKNTVTRTVEAAKIFEALGYTRIWYAEHHNTDTVLSTTPAVMIATAATYTRHIRLGSGGVMLPNHSPLHVAEDFSLLEAIAPGRIDLGLGRAPGTDPLTAFALRRSMDSLQKDDFPQQMEELLHYFDRDFPEEHPFRKITATASPDLMPEIFVLGSSTGGVQIAIDRGLGFAFAAHINPDLATPILNVYRDRFVPSDRFPEPYSILAIIAIVADTQEEAEYLAAPVELQFAQMSTGRIIQRISAKDAANHEWTPAERTARKEGAGRFVIGTKESVRDRLLQMAEDARADEIMIMDNYHDQCSRLKGATLLAEAFSLKEQSNE